MTVGELIEALRAFPEDRPVLLAGYEGGYGPPASPPRIACMKRDVHSESYYGPHEEAKRGDAGDFEAVIVE